jgi:hypothetical protein
MYLTIEFEDKPRKFDLYKFSKYILGYDLLQEDPHRRWCMQAERHDARSLYLKPRGTFKSTIYTISDTIWRLLENPDLRILIANATIDQAKQFLSEISGHYLRNERLRDVHYGLHKCEALDKGAASMEHITLNSRKIIRKEPSIGTIGALGNIVSSHYDIIKVDDLCNLKDRESPADREKKKRWFENLTPILVEGGELQVVGTRWHDQDCYDHIINTINPRLPEGEKYYIDIEPCWLDDGITPRFPTLLSKQRLDILKAQMGILVFACQEELNPLSGDFQAFKPENIHTIKHNEVDLSICRRYGALDASQGGEDLSSITSVAWTPDNHLLVFHADLAHDAQSDAAKKVAKFHRLFNYHKFWGEMNVLGLAKERAAKDPHVLSNFEIILKAEQEKEHVIVPWARIWNTQNKAARINSLEPHYTNGTLLFWDNYLQQYPEAITQLSRFPMGHDDFPDSLEIVVRGILELMNRPKQETKLSFTGATKRPAWK